jgi:hypothetical protein
MMLNEILQEKWRGELEADYGSSEIQQQPGAGKEDKAVHKTFLCFYDSELLKIDSRVFVDAWASLCEELASETSLAETRLS